MCLLFMVACLCYVIFLSHLIIDARLETLIIYDSFHHLRNIKLVEFSLQLDPQEEYVKDILLQNIVKAFAKWIIFYTIQ